MMENYLIFNFPPQDSNMNGLDLVDLVQPKDRIREDRRYGFGSLFIALVDLLIIYFQVLLILTPLKLIHQLRLKAKHCLLDTEQYSIEKIVFKVGSYYIFYNKFLIVQSIKLLNSIYDCLVLPDHPFLFSNASFSAIYGIGRIVSYFDSCSTIKKLCCH